MNKEKVVVNNACGELIIKKEGIEATVASLFLNIAKTKTRLQPILKECLTAKDLWMY